MNDTQRRTLRTFFQTTPAAVLVGIIAAFVPLDAPQAAALTALLGLIFTFGYNWLEDGGMQMPVNKS